MKCEQCGRMGERGYETLIVKYEGIDYGKIVVCANRNACRRRYERQRPPRWLDE